MTKQTFIAELEAQYGGPVPDLDEQDYREMYEEFGSEGLRQFGAHFIIACQRISRPTEREIEYMENFVETYAPRNKDGEIDDADFFEVWRIAQEQYKRLGLARIPFTKMEARQRMYDEQARIDANKE
jgi:hypothetical protein